MLTKWLCMYINFCHAGIEFCNIFFTQWNDCVSENYLLFFFIWNLCMPMHTYEKTKTRPFQTSLFCHKSTHSSHKQQTDKLCFLKRVEGEKNKKKKLWEEWVNIVVKKISTGTDVRVIEFCRGKSKTNSWGCLWLFLLLCLLCQDGKAQSVDTTSTVSIMLYLHALCLIDS